jgi:SOS response regulatory protein OraA/RecX
MTEIEGVRRKGRNYLVIVSGGREILLTKAVIDRYSIKAGSKIDLDSLEDIKHESDLVRAEDYVTYLLSRRSYSSGLLAAKLREKGYEKEVVRETLSRLKEKGLLDDMVFAREMAESILRRKPAGRNYIIARLRRDYISRSLAEAVVDELLENVDESDMAHRLLRNRWSYFSKFELETARRKAYNYLSRRSIGYNAARQAFEKVLKEENQD